MAFHRARVTPRLTLPDLLNQMGFCVRKRGLEGLDRTLDLARAGNSRRAADRQVFKTENKMKRVLVTGAVGQMAQN